MFQFAKIIRVLFAIFFLIVLLFIYAYLPLTLDIGIEQIGRVARNIFFYSTLGTFLTLNLLSHYLRYYVDRAGIGELQRLMVHLLPAVLYFCLTLLIGFIGVNNNADDIVPSTFFYLNYLSGLLPILWIFIFLFYFIKKK